MLREIQQAQQRLEAATQIADVEAAAWEAFELTRALCRGCEPQAGQTFAAFAMAAAAAVQARNLLSIAPSIPPRPGTPPGAPREHPASIDGAADDLATLAATLSEQLMSAARQPHGAKDRTACEMAAVQADAICALLIRE